MSTTDIALRATSKIAQMCPAPSEREVFIIVKDACDEAVEADRKRLNPILCERNEKLEAEVADLRRRLGEDKEWLDHTAGQLDQS